MDKTRDTPTSLLFLSGTLVGVFLLHPLAMSFFGTGTIPEVLVAALGRSIGEGMLPMTLAFAGAGAVIVLASFSLVETAARIKAAPVERNERDRIACVRCGRRFSPVEVRTARTYPGRNGATTSEMCSWCRSALVEGLLRGLSRWGRDDPETRPHRLQYGAHERRGGRPGHEA